MIIDGMSIIANILDWFACIWKLKVFEVKVWLISFEKNDFLFVFVYKSTLSAHSLHLSQKDAIQLALIDDLFFLQVELYSQWLKSPSECNFYWQDQLAILAYVDLIIER